MKTDAWPDRSMAELMTKATLMPSGSVSSDIVSQIADKMDGIDRASSSVDNCQKMLEKMPDFPDMEKPPEEPEPKDPNDNPELNKLLSTGYRPLQKEDGQWSETAVNALDIPNNTKLLLE